AAASASTAAAWYSGQGSKGQAARLGERVHSLVEKTEDPSIDLAVLELTALMTAREREVATMAALGRSDKDIAAALGVSGRIAETKLAELAPAHAPKPTTFQRKGEDS